MIIGLITPISSLITPNYGENFVFVAASEKELCNFSFGLLRDGQTAHIESVTEVTETALHQDGSEIRIIGIIT